MLQLNSREKICHFIANQLDMHSFLVFKWRNYDGFLNTEIAASERKWQKSDYQFYSRGLLESTCIFNVNGAICAVQTAYLQTLMSKQSFSISAIQQRLIKVLLDKGIKGEG